MGLTKNSSGAAVLENGLRNLKGGERLVALAGNPNVGKSTVFNALTGMNQHTGNWPGKTVSSAEGLFRTEKNSYILADIPGTYSLLANSAEEEVARNFICFGGAEAVVVVCSASCLERGLNLALQTAEITEKVIVCVNMMDEARKKKIRLDLPEISRRLGVPVVGVTARKRRSLFALTAELDRLAEADFAGEPCKIRYPEIIETAAGIVESALPEDCRGMNRRWLSLRILEGDDSLTAEASRFCGVDFFGEKINSALFEARSLLAAAGIDRETFRDMTVSAIVAAAEKICAGTVTYEKKGYGSADRRLDKILTGKLTGYPVMLCLLALVFWLTITGANYPSALLSDALFGVQDWLTAAFIRLGAPDWLHGVLVLGVYRVLAWVVSVMLPPMAIFFPLFTLLEDSGYLPRIAYNLDKPFRRCCACGKQALTMCMGFGCNAAGIVGCRIIDSPRERLLAVLTNSFVPCNGRFPTLIAIITMFFAFGGEGFGGSVLKAVLMTAIIVFCVLVTFRITKLLSKTVLKGVPSSFALELPPYRTPQIGKVIVRSIFDRTLFVLGRAAAVAAPAGMVIWLMANINFGGASLLNLCAEFLDPFAKLLGLDGVILMAFILGFPANEIVVPIIIMTYAAEGSILELGSLAEMRTLFVEHGWSTATAVSTMIFMLFHWPCSTSLLTVKKETGSWKWAALAAAIPTAVGIALCAISNALFKVIGI